MNNLITIIENLYTSAKTAEKDYSNEIQDFQFRLLDTNNKLTQTVSHISQLETKYINISKENEELKETVIRLKDEIANLKKVSIYTNLNKQIMEKDNYIAVLEKQMNIRQARETKPIEQEVVSTINDSSSNIEESVVGNTTEEPEGVEDTVEDEDTECDEDEDIETDEEEEDENEIEYQIVKIGKKYYYVSNEEPEMVYEVVKGTNDVGDQLGEYDKENNKIIR